VPGWANKIADALSRNPAWQVDAASRSAVVAAGVAVDADAAEGEVLSDDESDADVVDDDSVGSQSVVNPLQRVGNAPQPILASDDDTPDLMFVLPGSSGGDS